MAASSGRWRRSPRARGGDDLELRVGAVGGLLVGAPAAELRGVAEAGALHVVVGDLDDELRRAAAPTTGPCPGSSGSARPGTRCAGRVRARAQPAHSFHGWSSSAFSRYGARNSTSSRRFASVKLAHDADVLQLAGVVVEPEQQRADGACRSPRLVPAEAGDDAVALALVLHLQHHALVRLVGAAGAAWPSRRRAPRPRSAGTSRRRSRGRVVAGVRCSGGVAPREQLPRARARRSRNGAPRRSRSPSHSRSKNTIDAGISAASSFTREAAGWRRSCSASKSSPCRRARSRSRRRARSARAAAPCSGSTSSGK